jgi:hypothetical protein
MGAYPGNVPVIGVEPGRAGKRQGRRQGNTGGGQDGPDPVPRCGAGIFIGDDAGCGKIIVFPEQAGYAFQGVGAQQKLFGLRRRFKTVFQG